MPSRDESRYNIVVPGEPQIVTEIRKKILDSFQGLEFIEDGHKYFLNGEELLPVSTVAGKYEHEFDAIEKSKAYAEKHGQTPEYWQDQWRFTNLKATTKGTLVHSYAESLGWKHMKHPENITDDNLCKYIAEKDWLIPTRPQEEAALNFWKEFPENMWVVLPETRIYNIGNTIKYAGTFDLLVYYDCPTNPEKSGLMILDWKTNSNIYKDFSRTNGRMMLPPFDNLYDEPLGGYTLQLTLYAMALEKIGLKVIGRRIVWLKEDTTFEIVPVDYMKEQFLSIDNKLL
jgi:hypothetical protein